MRTPPEVRSQPSQRQWSLIVRLLLGGGAKNSNVDLIALHAALEDGSAANFVIETEMIGRNYGVNGTPAWLLGQRLIMGLRPPAEFERLAEYSLQVPH